MARRKAATAAEPVEEIFTDLRGNPDLPEGVTDPLDADDLEAELQDEGTRRRAAVDPDLTTIIDDDEEQPEVPVEEPEEPAEIEVEPELEAPVAEQPGVEEFDPRDIQLIAERAKNLELRENAAKDAVTRADADMAAAEVAMTEAQEAGNTKANVAATKAYAKAVADKNMAEGVLTNQIVGEKAQLTRDAQAAIAKAPKGADGKPILDRRVERKAPTAAQPAKPKGSKLFPDFVKHNAWFNDQKNASKREVLIALDKELTSEKKLDINSAAYFAELGKRFNRVHPGMFRTPDGKPIATGKIVARSAAPVPNGGAGGNGERTLAGGFDPKSVKLTNADLQQMRVFGLDSNDLKVRGQWLVEKRAIAAKERVNA